MKPLKLTMSAFGPYAGAVEIPFSEMLDHGLYLITGDTGAGKTTIFDGIAYALYGESSGKSREVSSMRSDFAPADAETYVELEFRFRGETYRVRRRPEYERPNKRNPEKMTKVPAEAELQLPDGTVITGIRPVTAKVEELLGMDRNQFSQIVMIAQGDFLKLLHAGTNDRREILRKIFNTKKYEDFQQQLKARAKALEATYKDGEKAVLQYAEQLNCAPDYARKEDFDRLRSGGSYYLLDELLKLSEESDREEQQTQNTLDEQTEQIAVQQAQLHRAMGTMQQQNLQTNTYLENRAKLERLRPKQKELELRLQQEQAQEPERERCWQNILHLQEMMPKYGALESAQQKLRQSRLSYEKLLKQQKTLTEEDGQLQLQLQTLEQQLQGTEQTGTALEKATHTYGEYQTRQSHLQQLRTRYDAWRETAIQLQKGQKDYEVAEEQARMAGETAARLERRFRREQAGILAADLTEGQPCPVCGAVHHPQLAVCTEDAPTEESVEQAKQKSEQLNGLWQKQSTLTASLRATCAAQEQQFREQAEGFLPPELPDKDIPGQIESELQAVREQVRKWTDTIHVLERQKEQRQQAQEQRTNKLNRQNRLQQELQQVHSAVSQQLADCSAAEKETEMLRSGLDYATRNEAEQAMQQWQSRQTALERALEHAKTEKENGEKALRECQAVLETLEKNGVRPELQDLTPLETENQRLKSLQETYFQRQTEISGRLSANERLRGKIRRTREDTEDVSRQYLMVQNLSDTANGELKGKPRIAFESYIQAAYFDQVIEAANLRLNYMSSGRYELVRQQETSNLRSQTGLELDVMDYYTGKCRGVKTLSGGESFKASLSLALGLSDVVQRYAGGVEIDAMFVDEGFGTLDAESRQQAIQILNGLTDDNRMVGIISHVAEFRESIDRQILVEKSTDGSRVRLVY